MYLQRILTILFFSFIFIATGYGQTGNDKPKADLSTPYDAVFTLMYYLQPESYDVNKAARPFYKGGDEGKELAIQLKQILDGKGLKVRLSMVPEAPAYMDSLTQKNVYILFPKEFPEIYLERNKLTRKWHFSHETEREIPILHKKVYPFGSDLLLNLLPKMGQQRFLGLALWQYLALLILGAIGFLLHFFSSRLLQFLIRLVASSRLGKDHFDKKIVKRIARILSYLLVIYLVYILIPVVQLPIGLVYYLLLCLRLTTTVLIVLLALRIIAFIRSYLEELTKATTNTTDEHLLPIIIRIVNAVIIVVGFINILGTFHVNVTALVAGLSIGGLAIALAAQETVKNLIGSMMIYADRPFKIGDFVTVGAVTGTVVDIGFRSTRIKTPDTSIVSVPNGNLMNETINNLGEREMRRFNTAIGVTYHTPPDLIAAFVKGLRELILLHPNTVKEPYYVHLNNLGGSSIDILFVVYFNTIDWAEELKYKEELIFAILRLAEALGVQIAFPSTSVYIETMPEKKGLVPEYKEELQNADSRLAAYLEDYKAKFPTTVEEGTDY